MPLEEYVQAKRWNQRNRLPKSMIENMCPPEPQSLFQINIQGLHWNSGQNQKQKGGLKNPNVFYLQLLLSVI